MSYAEESRVHYRRKGEITAADEKDVCGEPDGGCASAGRSRQYICCYTVSARSSPADG